VLHKPDGSKKHQGALDVIKKMDKKEERRRAKKLPSESDTDTDTDCSVDDEPQRTPRKIAKPRRRVKSFLDDEAREDRKTGNSFVFTLYKSKIRFVYNILTGFFKFARRSFTPNRVETKNQARRKNVCHEKVSLN
jgi:hypothetical protein